MEARQSKILEGYETLITDKIDKTLNKRLKHVSQEVADTVTMQMMQAMSGFFQRKQTNQHFDINTSSEVITQDSPLKGNFNTLADQKNQQIAESMTSTHRKIQTGSHPTTVTSDMKTPSPFVTDSPHDKPALESLMDSIR